MKSCLETLRSASFIPLLYADLIDLLKSYWAISLHLCRTPCPLPLPHLGPLRRTLASSVKQTLHLIQTLSSVPGRTLSLTASTASLHRNSPITLTISCRNSPITLIPPNPHHLIYEPQPTLLHTLHAQNPVRMAKSEKNPSSLPLPHQLHHTAPPQTCPSAGRERESHLYAILTTYMTSTTVLVEC